MPTARLIKKLTIDDQAKRTSSFLDDEVAQCRNLGLLGGIVNCVLQTWNPCIAHYTAR